MTLLKLIDNLLPYVIKAGDKILNIYEKEPKKEIKEDGSPVTEADKASEKIILTGLKKFMPGTKIISEETLSNHHKNVGRKFFLVDPLDGTKEFLKRDGKGSFTVNIGLIENNIPIMGIIYAPALDELYFGCQNFGAWKIKDGKKAKISISSPQKDKVTAVASESHRDVATNQWLKYNNIKKIIYIGSSLKFCLVASGYADVYPRFGPTMEWDTAAGHAILSASGGALTNTDLSKFNYGKNLFKNGPFIAWGGYERK